MTTFQYQHRGEEFSAVREQQERHAQQNTGGIQINSDSGRNYSTVIRDGATTSQDFSGSTRVNSSQLNPHYGDCSVFETARSPHGFHVFEIGPDTLITINGVEGTVKGFEAAGLVHRTANGTYAEGSGRPEQAPQETPQQESTADALSMPEEVAAGVDSAIDCVSDMHLDALVSGVVGVATGEGDLATLERRFVSYSGVTPAEAASRVAFVQAAYQAQADAAITSRCGIAREDLQGFYQWCRETQRGVLRDAVNRQIRQSDFSGYRALAGRYFSTMPPTVEAVQAGGYQVRKHAGADEVMIDGNWMTIRNAARLGYL